MPRDVWPPKYVNEPIGALLDKGVSNGAYRFLGKLRALAWGEPTLRLGLDRLMELTGLGQSQVYEYARLLRDRNWLLFSCAQSVFECSFTDAPIPENPEKPTLSISSKQVRTTEEGANSGKPGKRNAVEKPKAVEKYREAAKSWPSKAQWPAIEQAVGTDPARLELWGKVVAGYVLKGWNPRNVAGMLEFFGRGEVPGANGNKPKKSVAAESAGPWRRGA